MRSEEYSFVPIQISTCSETNGKVDGFRAESLDGMPRNQWTTCSGMAGRLGPEYALESHSLDLTVIVMKLQKLQWAFQIQSHHSLSS